MAPRTPFHMLTNSSALPKITASDPAFGRQEGESLQAWLKRIQAAGEDLRAATWEELPPLPVPPPPSKLRLLPPQPKPQYKPLQWKGGREHYDLDAQDE